MMQVYSMGLDARMAKDPEVTLKRRDAEIMRESIAIRNQL
jgi:hypothetical protein